MLPAVLIISTAGSLFCGCGANRCPAVSAAAGHSLLLRGAWAAERRIGEPGSRDVERVRLAGKPERQ